MGFTPKRKHYRLKFEDPDLDGLEVLMSSATLKDLLAIQSLDLSNSEASMTPVLEVLSRAIISWNVEDEEGNAVPTTVEGIESQELPFVMDLITAWTQAVSSVAPPLPGGSNSGDPSPEGLRLTEASSLSL